MSKFTGENYGVARQFAESYDGNRVMIGSSNFLIDSAFISEATGLPLICKPWFKGKTLVAIDYNLFLKNEYKDPDWKVGITTKWLRDEWRGSIEVI